MDRCTVIGHTKTKHSIDKAPDFGGLVFLCTITPPLSYSSLKLLLPYDRGGKGGVVGIALGGLAEQEVWWGGRTNVGGNSRLFKTNMVWRGAMQGIALV